MTAHRPLPRWQRPDRVAVTLGLCDIGQHVAPAHDLVGIRDADTGEWLPLAICRECCLAIVAIGPYVMPNGDQVIARAVMADA